MCAKIFSLTYDICIWMVYFNVNILCCLQRKESIKLNTKPRSYSVQKVRVEQRIVTSQMTGSAGNNAMA